VKLKKTFYIVSIIALLFFALVSYDVYNGKKNNFSETVKIALRDAGHKLLLSNNDSTSLILPVIEFDKNRYKLSFENKLSIVPDSLVKTLSKSLKDSNLIENYIVEVINCRDKEVSYSYQVAKNIESNIIPCLGRNLPLDCYLINVHFINDESYLKSFKNYSLLSMVVIGFVAIGLFYRKKEKKIDSTNNNLSYSSIGNYKFYKDQNKLVKDNIIIKLTSKECELIKIFSENQNQIVKRDLLIKEVWEDNGVFVGRSLDAFISKIRKKFENDNSVNIINVHGVGYKLEVS